MATPIRRPADTIYWASPLGRPCSLTPMSGGQGMLEIELVGDVVMIHSRNCLLVQGDAEDDFREIAEFEATMSLQRCQINWSFAEKTTENTVERSAYFAQ